MMVMAVNMLFVFFTSILSVTTGANTYFNIYQIPEEIMSHGYPAERHHVVTEDGYILEMHRIPHGPNEKKSKRPVVFVMHGLLSSSQTFITIGPEKGLAYNLAAAGFDVWMGNARGNRLSRKHTKLSPTGWFNKKKFFDFSFEQIGTHDVAAMIDYALAETGQSQLHYIGHSQGGTAFLVLMSMRDEYNKKIKSAHLLAGVGYQKHFPNKNIERLTQHVDTVYSIAKALHVVELFPPDGIKMNETRRGNVINPTLCAGRKKSSQLCQLIGMGELTESIDEKSSEIAGAATKQVIHYGQNIRDKTFRRWNYGVLANVYEYGDSKPPEYNLKLITAPVTMHYSAGDALLDERDVLAMVKEMPNANARKVARESFLHSDYVQADDCKEMAINYVIDSMLELEEKTYLAADLRESDVMEEPLSSSSPMLAISVLTKTFGVYFSLQISLSTF